MNRWRRALLACAAASAITSTGASSQAPSAPATEIDAVAAAPDEFRILLENEHVRVIEYMIAPGRRDPWHTHPPKLSYVISGGSLRIHFQNGEHLDVTETTGEAHWAGALGVHSAENIGSTPVRILLVEVKAAH